MYKCKYCAGVGEPSGVRSKANSSSEGPPPGNKRFLKVPERRISCYLCSSKTHPLRGVSGTRLMLAEVTTLSYLGGERGGSPRGDGGGGEAKWRGRFQAGFAVPPGLQTRLLLTRTLGICLGEGRMGGTGSQKIQVEGPSPSWLWQTFASSHLDALP